MLTSHYESSLSEPGKVHFYLDRVDLANPAAPRFLGKVNVPGSLLAWDGASGRAITVDYRRVVQTGISVYDCLGRGGAAFTPDPLNYQVGSCTLLLPTLRQVRVGDATAVLEGSWEVPSGFAVSTAATGDGRVFVGLNRRYGYYYPYPPGGGGGTGGTGAGPVPPCSGPSCVPTGPSASLVVLSGLGSGALQATTLQTGADSSLTHISQLFAFGQRVLVRSSYYQDDLLIVDASQAAAPRVVRTVDVLGSLQDVRKYGDRALLSLGFDGLSVIDVSQ